MSWQNRNEDRDFLSSLLLACLALALATLAVFWPARNFDFVNFDDPDYVLHNPHVLRGLTPEDVGWAFRTGHASNWHPLTWLSHMLDANLFGATAGGPHLVNLLLHTASALLLFLLLRQITRAHWRSALVAALFAWHPLHVESVAWIAERKDVLSGFFAMLTLMAYARYAAQLQEANSPVAIARRRRFYWLSLVLFALGLMAKPMLVTLPFVMLLLDFWPLGRLSWARQATRHDEAPDAKDAQQHSAPHSESAASLILEKVPFFVLTALSCVVTVLVQKKAGAIGSLARLPLGGRMENALVSYARYLGKTFWPARLAVPYPYPGHWPALVVALAALVVIGLSVGALALARRWPFLATGWFWFLGMLVPVIGLVQVGNQAMADRYTYLPLVGVFIVIAWSAGEVVRQLKLPPAAPALAAAAILGACAARTRVQLSHWRDSGTLFSHSIAVTRNNWLAHDNLGQWLFEQGRTGEALEQYQAALKINSDDYLAWDNLGYYEYRRGRLDAAVQDYNRSLRLKPDNPTALNNLGSALVGQKKYADAVRCYQAALRLNPDYVEAHINLGAALAGLGRNAEAVAQYRAALHLAPDSAQAHNNLANALAGQGRFAQAIAHYRAALAAQPDFPDAWHNLAIVLTAVGRTNDAIACYENLLQLQPDNAEAKQQLQRLGAKSR